MVEDSATFLDLGCNLAQPDRGFDGLDLTKERTDAAEGVVAPVLKEARRLRCDVPIARTCEPPPCVDPLPHLVDHRHRFVTLVGTGDLLGLIENEFLLGGSTSPFPRLGNRGDELSTATMVDDSVRRLTSSIQLPVPGGERVRRVQDRLLKERVHNRQLHAPEF